MEFIHHTATQTKLMMVVKTFILQHQEVLTILLILTTKRDLIFVALKINHITSMILVNMFKNALKDIKNADLINLLFAQKTKNVQQLNLDIKMKTNRQQMSISILETGSRFGIIGNPAVKCLLLKLRQVKEMGFVPKNLSYQLRQVGQIMY